MLPKHRIVRSFQWSRFFDKLNFQFFYKSSKHNTCVDSLAKTVLCFKKTMKYYHKICWLNRWQVITARCNSIKKIYLFSRGWWEKINYYKVCFGKIGLVQAYLHLIFLVDILHLFTILLKVWMSQLWAYCAYWSSFNSYNVYCQFLWFEWWCF